MPDIEKRLEAFVRIGHGIIVFPGGVGTAEEILYLLGILLHPDNAEPAVPADLHRPGPPRAPYFEQIDEFIRLTLGEEAAAALRDHHRRPGRGRQEMQAGIRQVREYRMARRDAFYFNWLLQIDRGIPAPVRADPRGDGNLDLHQNQDAHLLAANLRRAFSGIVAGNVKEDGMRAIEEFGPFEIHGDPDIMGADGRAAGVVRRAAPHEAAGQGVCALLYDRASKLRSQ